MRVIVPLTSSRRLLIAVAACAAAAIPVIGAPATASAASRCSSFSYRAPDGGYRITVTRVRVSGLGCTTAKKKIRSGEDAASSPFWIAGYDCRIIYEGYGRRCTRGRRTISFRAKH